MSRKNKSPTIKNSGYSGGGASMTKKTLKTFTPTHFSATSDIDRNLATLRNRAADLVMNSPIGAAAVNVETTNVVGAGLRLFPRLNSSVLGVTPEYAREWSRRVKLEFELWANNAFACDYLRRNNFYELQNISFGSYLADGDNFVLFKRRLPTPDCPYSLRIQLIDAQRVSNPVLNGGALSYSNVEMKRLGSNNRIVNGIEVDKDGVQVAIWISNRIWNEPTTMTPELTWQRVRWYGRDTHCLNVLHICHDTRPDMNRGVPLLAPVIETLKQISRYGDAELSSAIVKSFFSVFFVQPAANYDINEMLGTPDEPPKEEKDKPCVDVGEYKLGVATMAALPQGVDVKAIDSSNAQSTFDAFMGSFLKQVGAALNLPFEVLMKNFTASYSASRAALLQAADEFRQRKAWFVQDFLQPIYDCWLSEAVALGRIDAPGFFEDPLKRAAWTAADWYNESTHLLDVTKEVEGAQMRIALGLSTYRKEAAELAGVDFEDNLETLATEYALKQKLLPSTAETQAESPTNDEIDAQEQAAQEDTQ